MRDATTAPPREGSLTRAVYPRSQGCVAGGVFAKSSSVLLQAEARELERCAALDVRTPHVQAANLLRFDAATNVLQTKFVSGGSLFNVLWNGSSWLGAWRLSSRHLARVASRMSEVGQWLRAYHGTSRRPATPQPAIDWLVASYRKKLEAASQRRLLEPPLLEAFERHCALAEHLLLHDAHPCLATIHGDFTGYNLLVDAGGGLHVVDFADTREGLPIEDVVKLWQQLHTLAATSGRRRRLLGTAAAEFLEGYGLGEEVCEARDFQTLRMYNVLTHLNSTSAAWGYLGRGGRRAARRIDAIGLDWARRTLRRLDLL